MTVVLFGLKTLGSGTLLRGIGLDESGECWDDAARWMGKGVPPVEDAPLLQAR